MKKGTLTIALLVLCAVCAGCTSLGGNAAYAYSKTADGKCSIKIDSGRELPAGFDVQIGADCSLTGKASAATQGRQAISIGEVTDLIRTVREPQPDQ